MRFTNRGKDVQPSYDPYDYVESYPNPLKVTVTPDVTTTEPVGRKKKTREIKIPLAMFPATYWTKQIRVYTPSSEAFIVMDASKRVTLQEVYKHIEHHVSGVHRMNLDAYIDGTKYPDKNMFVYPGQIVKFIKNDNTRLEEIELDQYEEESDEDS